MRKYGLLILLLIPILTISAHTKAQLNAKILELLDQYSSDGAWIAHGSVEKPGMEGDGDLSAWAKDAKTEEDLINCLPTVVHEETHSRTSGLTRSLFRERLGHEPDDWSWMRIQCAILGGERFVPYQLTNTFPSREMVEAFPKNLRTFRFTYIDTREMEQSTQGEGIYGLMGEMDAYYMGSKTAMDCIGWYERKGQTAPWHSYFQNVHVSFYGCWEFKLYILKYLMFAKTDHPDIYRELMSNRNLLLAFVEVDRSMTRMASDWEAVKKDLFSRFAGWGWKTWEKDDDLWIQKGNRSSGHGTFMSVLRMLDGEMEKPEYQNLMREIKNRIGDWTTAQAVESVLPGGGSDRQGNPYLNGTEDEAFDDAAEYETDELSSHDDQDIESDRSTCDQDNDVLTDEPFCDDERRIASNRPPNENLPSFVDLTGASSEWKNGKLTIRMQLAGLPQLWFNRKGVGDDVLEYEWAANVDVNGDGDADYRVSIDHYREAGARLVRGAVLDHCQSYLWRFKGDEAESVETPIDARQRGNTLILTLTGKWARELHKGTIWYETTYFDGKKQVGDEVTE